MEHYDILRLRQLPIQGVAQRLGLRVNSRHQCLCPFHDDHHPSMSLSPRTNHYRCFVCDAHGDTIDLVRRCLGLDFPAACRWLADETGVVLADYQPSETAREQKPFDTHRYARYFEHPWLSDAARRFLFQERRLDPRVVRWCRITSWRDRNGTPWLQTPYYDRQGQLVGVQNRNLSASAAPVASVAPVPLASAGGHSAPQPRFRFPAGSRCAIYNLPVLNRLRPGDELWITEGCSDCWAMLSNRRKAIAIPSATLLTPPDRALLAALSDAAQGPLVGLTFHMYPDQDAPGERLFMQLRQVLPTLQHHQLPSGCKDFSDYYLSLLPPPP